MLSNPMFWTTVLVFYLWHTFGVTIGLHRLLSHRAFKCPKAVEYFFVSGAYLAFHGSPAWWATIHRNHHRYVETPLDPHSPRQGIFHAYFFYRAFKYPPHMSPAKQCPDLMKDPVYRFLERGGDWKWGYLKCVSFALAFRVLLYQFFGFEVMMASFLAGFLAWNVPLILNIVCHIPRLGYRNFAIADDSNNNYFFGLVALGDGWHNNHHARPGSSQMGLKKHEFDLSWFTLKCLQKVGLVYSINESLSDMNVEAEDPTDMDIFGNPQEDIVTSVALVEGAAEPQKQLSPVGK
ncbi:MAG: acyl-CoA desaturase [Candidatus Obscuribacterales bacterium]|nr:acyl-CoA desaturase [Candidatus Obscuribacterales bacterium]